MRLAPLVLVVAVGGLVAASLAQSKEGARAHLTAPLPLDAAPGTTIRVRWTVDVPNEKGDRAPFGAGDMFIRILSRTGAASTTAFTNTIDGRNTADVVVPAGGIGGIRVGLRGTTEILFPLVNDPFMSAAGVRCDVGVVHAMLVAFVRAYNRGDLRRLDRLFSRNRFVWYSAPAPGSRVRPDAANRNTLMPYFRRRHRHGERLTLLTYRVGYDAGRQLSHFHVSVRRWANGLAGGSVGLRGKGTLDCTSAPAAIAALSLGGA